MISIELDSSLEGLEIFLDDSGVAELISYLNYISRNDESLHLVMGGELADEKIVSHNTSIKHAKIIFLKEPESQS